MRFDKVEQVLADKPEVFERFMEIVENVRGVPLIGATNGFLSSDNPHLHSIAEKNVEGLVNFVIRFNSRLAKIIVDNNKIEKTIEKMEKPFYRMRVSGRIRVATAREIAEGATGLVAEKKYAIQDEEKRKMLWLLAWAASGNDYYFYKIGKGFQKDVMFMKLYSQISNASKELEGLMNWAEEPYFQEEIEDIKRFARSNYQYPDYEVDEVIEEYTRKQILYMLDETIPRGTENKEYRRALALIIREKTNKFYKVPPEEVAELRVLYKKILENKPKALRDERAVTTVNEKLKSDCEYLLKARDAGVIHRNEFVFKVIGTCIERGYVLNISEKQGNIIREAIEKVDKKLRENSSEESKALEKLVAEMNRRLDNEREAKEKIEERRRENPIQKEEIPEPEISEEELAEMDRMYEDYGLGEGLEEFSNMLGDGFI